MITISNYKNPNESNKNTLSDIELKALDNELIDLIKKGKHVKAIKKYRLATGAGLVKAKEHIDFLSKVEL
ncbi:hypothetical protein [Clostridium sp. Marseille-Q2269]|uniref:hypothetical protein n=1 Tax=Clostridium sp. Marseille-Q2269 TaxID=2942205 RepID=UPI0020740EE3|nr:hypothetical protein [Clostridium sp. Marseille-Q2269]